jgi:hypothetical protein
LVLRNNSFSPQPFLFADFADSASGGRVEVDDLFIEQNLLWNPDWTVESAGSYRNHFFRRALEIEIKSAGARSSIQGNYFKGWVSDFQQTAPAIEIDHIGSNSTLPNGPNHMAIEYNVFDRGDSALQLISPFDAGGRGAHKLFNFTEKIRFAHNLVVRTDTIKYRSGLAGNATGRLITATSGYRDFVIERNTVVPERTDNGQILDLGNHRSSGLQVKDNILGFTEGANTNLMGVFQDQASGQIPAETEDGGYAAFQEFNVRGTGTDPLSEWTGNIALPMLKQSNVGTYSVKAASSNPADTHCQSSLSVQDKVLNLPQTYVGNTNSPCNQSLNDRLALLFESGTFEPAATYSGKGADLGALADAQGLPGPVTVTANSSSVTLSFHAPTTAACPVDLTPWSGAWAASWDNAGSITRAQDPSPDQEQVVSFGGLNPNTTYAYRGHCKRGFIGLVTTAGAF